MSVSWKGRTFNQIVTKLKKNKNDMTSTNIFIHPPIKQYRRELVSTGNCSRATISMTDFNVPGGTVVNSATGKGVHIVDFILPNDKTERPENNSCAIRANDARRRMRSSGNIKSVINSDSITTVKYCSSSIQYLESKNRKFDQNNYSVLKYGEPTFKDGIPSTMQNVYTPNGINECAKVVIKMNGNPLFTYTWINGNTYPIYINDGNYDLEDINKLLINILDINKHYLIDTYRHNSKVYYFKFAYDSASDRIQIQCSRIGQDLFPSERYVEWTSFLIAIDWEIPIQPTIPQINILNNEFKNMIGFVIGSYPQNIVINSDKNYYVFGEKSPIIKSRCKPVYYKPRDVESSSSVVTRLRYETITTAATTYTTPLGRSVASALAYNIPAPGYSYKYVLGYPEDCVPEVDGIRKIMKTGCNIKKIKGG
jgi:hypothetical protein